MRLWLSSITGAKWRVFCVWNDSNFIRVIRDTTRLPAAINVAVYKGKFRKISTDIYVFTAFETTVILYNRYFFYLVDYHPVRLSDYGPKSKLPFHNRVCVLLPKFRILRENSRAYVYWSLSAVCCTAYYYIFKIVDIYSASEFLFIFSPLFRPILS